ncbi:hypothetical protein TrVFT333_009982 [Trichoderma virens FT-333]|nr:hypothetical protein TrVFT333_009982 [Trichoderma virens FT-333]
MVAERTLRFGCSVALLYPFIHLALGLASSPLGDIRLYRVFDPGAAFLVTPSFLVSEPEHAYSFLKWFWNNYVKTFDVSRPRKLVLCAKVDEWMNNLYLEQITTRRKHPASASEEELNAKGISDKAIECRWKTFKLFQQLLADAPDEGAGSIVLAPEAIDGNDEQSLVNWFGEWSTLNIDQYRRYTVIGCGWQSEERLSRTLRAPNYEENVINDPDEALAGAPSQLEPSSPPPSAPRAFREDESLSIKERLFEMSEEAKRDFTPVKTYLYPVAYSTSDVAFRLGDITSKYYTYEQWFNFFWKVFDPTRRLPQNSYAGLFYTFNEQQASSRAFRNVQHKLPLEKVWVGAFGAKPGSAPALDITIQWLGGLSMKVKDWIPAPAKDIAGRGWNLVTAERSSGDQEGNGIPARGEDDVKGHSPPEEDASARKRIFHPPQGHGQYKYTKCRNRLYQWARQFDPKMERKSFEYVFRPTIDWYSEQCEEGRGFEHIKVLPWKDIFQVYKIEEFLQKRG